MPFWLFLMLFGLSASVAGGWVALDIRGSAEALKEFQRRGHELSALAAGTFTPRPNKVTRIGLRPYAALVGLAGSVLALAGVAELLTGG
ncbi:hypothetical protein ACFYXJ_32915 [Streptomyces sp. NPDC002667]|uniref:hypothetical protein n=1 Tax=Streptomyces sp. NPDC002667 TaxID=3364657 RepID=UPI003693A0C2